MSDTESRSPDYPEEQQLQQQQNEQPAVSDTEVDPETSMPEVVEDSQPEPQEAAETAPEELPAEAECGQEEAEAKKELEEPDEEIVEAGEKAEEAGEKAVEAGEKAEEAGEKAEEVGEEVEESCEKAEEGGDKTEEGEDATEPEAVEGENGAVEVAEEEEPIVINPDGNPHWLSTEDILSKGLPESEVENFRAFYFKQAHSLQTWYEVLKEYAIETEFITLSKEEIDALSVEGVGSEEEQEILNGLQARIDSAIELYNGDGALVKINDRSAKDSILDRSDESFVQGVRDSVINSLEVEKQAVYAYSIWKDMGSNPGILKRGMNKLKASFRRSRAGHTAVTRRRQKLEEEKNEGEEELASEVEEGDPKPATDEAPTQEGNDENMGTKVIVEAQVEAADVGESAEATAEPSVEAGDKEEEERAGEDEEPPKRETDGEPAQEVQVEEDEPAQEVGGERREERDVQPVAATNQEGNKTKEAAVDGEEKKDAGIKKVKKAKHKAAAKYKQDDHRHKAAKEEPLDNQVLRAFERVMGSLYLVQDGESAIKQLKSSIQIRTSLNSLKAFGGVEGVQVSLSLIRWNSQISTNRGMIFRGFVYNNELQAISQYDDTVYFPDVAYYKDSVICGKIQCFFQDNIKEPLAELQNYIIDFFVAPEMVRVVRMNPFAITVGACLFTWANDTRVLTKGPLQFSIVDTPKIAPDAFTSYQPFWQDMLQSVLQQRSSNEATSSKCVIL